MSKIPEAVFERAKEEIADAIEDMVTSLGIVKAHVKVAKTKADLDSAVKTWTSSLDLMVEVNKIYEAVITPPKKRKKKEKKDA